MDLVSKCSVFVNRIKMLQYVVIAWFLRVMDICNSLPAPMRVTIDCGTKNKNRPEITNLKLSNIFKSDDQFNVAMDSFCDLIHKAIPKAIKNGKFVLVGQDLSAHEDSFKPVYLPAPDRFEFPRLRHSGLDIPRLRLPNLKIPKINVPKLSTEIHLPHFRAPILGEPMQLPMNKDRTEESSAEKMEKFKKGIQKMLHVMKVIGQIDQYLSERTRIVIDKLSKTFAE